MAPKGPVEPVTCPICGFTTKKNTNFIEHCSTVHNISGEKFEELWLKSKGLKERPKCGCGCGSFTKWNGWKNGYSSVVNGHNGFIYNVNDEETAKEIAEKRRQKLIGKEGWAKGLTKETDERIKLRGEKTSIGRKKAFDEGRIKVWIDGLTKETDSRVAELSKTLKNVYAKGDAIPWAKGLTLKTDERIVTMARRVSSTMQQESMKKHFNEIRKLPSYEVKDRIESKGTLKIVNGSLDDYFNDKTPNILVECVTCGTQTYGSLRHLQFGRCFNCAPGGSAAQFEIYNFIKSIDTDSCYNVRGIIGHLELDIYSKATQFAVEYNGLFWHNEYNRTDAYHDNKTQLSLQKDIKLMHVFEDEWREKRNIIESMIRHKMNSEQTRISARECVIEELDGNTRKSFFDTFHIDGDVKTTKSYGLIHDGKIVAAISLRRPFHKKYENFVEIGRFCTACNHHVPGALSRLAKIAKSYTANIGKSGLITYLDTRHGGMNSYSIAGFSQASLTPPRFWWTDYKNRFNRFKYRADSANGLTERDVAAQVGVVKIWGCRNVVYTLTV